MLRSIFVIGLMLVGLRYAFKGPFYILLCYLWVAYFRPEQWLWFDFTSTLNLSFILGVAVLVAAVFSGQRWRLGLGPAICLAFLAQSLVSTMFSPAFDTAWKYWQEFARTITLTYMITLLVTSEERVRLTLQVMAFSLAFEGAKQGFVQFALNPTAPNDNPLPMFGDNNGVAVGMLMLVPLLAMLANTARDKRERYLERFLSLGVFLRALGTYSRGAFIAASGLALHYVLRSKRRLVNGIVVVAVGTLVVLVLPDRYWIRISTIQSDTENPDKMDSSAAGRLYFWQVALDMADSRPLTGVGHNAFNVMYNTYDRSGGRFGYNRAVHSAWFGVLAELGYPGLVLFVTIILISLFSAARARRAARMNPELENLALYATAIEGSIVVFAIGGSFVDMQFCEMLWHLFAVQIAIDRLIRARIAVADQNPVRLRGLLQNTPVAVTVRGRAPGAPLLR